MSAPGIAKSARMCHGCRASDGRLFDVREKLLEQAFAELTGLVVNGGLLCSVCLQLLRKFSAFRACCVNTYHIMQQFPMDTNVLSTLDSRTHLKLLKTDLMHIDVPPSHDSAFDLQYNVKIETKDDPQLKHEVLEKYEISHIDTVVPSAFIIPQDVTCGNQIENVDNALFDDDDVDMVDDENITDEDDSNIKNTYVNKPESADKNKAKKKTKKYNTRSKKTGTEMVGNYDIAIFNDNDMVDVTDEDDSDVKLIQVIKPEKANAGTSNENNAKKKTAKRTTRSKKANKEMVMNNDRLIYEISHLFVIIWKKVLSKQGDLYEMFERMYQESLNRDRTELTTYKSLTENETISEAENIVRFVDLYKQAADVHNIEVEFVSISCARAAMDARRAEAAAASGGVRCRQCCRTYRGFDTYERHVERSHDARRPHRCLVCQYTFKKQREYLLHVLKMHAMKKTCKLCGQNIVTYYQRTHWEDVRAHMEAAHHTGGRDFRCEHCGKGFGVRHDYYLHLRESHAALIDSRQCLLCGDSYNGPYGLRNHFYKMHTQAVQCGVCSVWFVDGATMETHKRGGECDKELSGCPLCGATFPTEPLMRKHYDEAHAALSKDKKTRNRSGTGRKEREKSLICDVCGKAFELPINLRYHQRIHTGEKPHECDHCGKKFRAFPTLWTHMLIHKDERRYKCELCPKTFRQAPHLKSHMVTHTKEKNHACSLCPKRYTMRRSLQEHVRTAHEGLPPFHRNRRRGRAPPPL